MGGQLDAINEGEDEDDPSNKKITPM